MESLEEIRVEVAELRVKSEASMDSIRGKVDGLLETVGALRSLVERVDAALHRSNGVPPVMVRLDSLEQGVEEFTRNSRLSEETRKKVMADSAKNRTTVIVAAIASAGAVVAALLK